jgi:hypothetical protein
VCHVSSWSSFIILRGDELRTAQSFVPEVIVT